MLVKPIEAPAVCSRDALLQDFEGELLQQAYPPSTVHRKKRLFADLSDAFVNSIWPTLMLSFGPPHRPTISLALAGA